MQHSDIAGISNYGSQNVAIDGIAGNYKQIYQATINNSEISTGTSTITGAGTTAFISDSGIVVGEKYALRIEFNAGIPSPYGATTQLFIHGIVTDSSTITFTTQNFDTQGSGDFTLHVFNAQDNSIAIGYNVQTQNSNEIKIGNSNHTLCDIECPVVIGATTMNTSAKLEVTSTSKGFLPPRMTTSQRDAISSPAKGLIIYNTTTDKHQGYNGIWNDLY